MNTRIMKLCAWSGVASIVVVAIGFVFAGFIPPPSPSDDAAQTAQLYRDNANGIRFGMILVMYGSSLLMPFSAMIALQMRRIEGRFAVLALTEFGMGAVFVLEFIYLAFFWITGTYRTDRPDAIVQTLNDMGWIPFIGLSSTLVIQSAAFGIVILADTHGRYFPRWLGYYNLWAALSFTPGTFNMFFHDGPLAWNGVISYWYPVPVFVTWMIVNPIFLAKSVDRGAAYDAETAAAETATTAPHTPTDEGMAVELAELRDQIARVSAKVETVS